MKKSLFLFVSLTIGCGSSPNPAIKNPTPDSGITVAADALASADDANVPAIDGAIGQACAIPAPCGGNIVGSWRIVNACLPNVQALLVSQMGPKFAGCYINVVFGYAGEIDYHSDGTFVVQKDGGTNSYIDMEERCYELQNGKTCAESAPRCHLDNGICRCSTAGSSVDAGTYNPVSTGTYLVRNGSIIQRTVTADDLPEFSSNALYKNNPLAAGLLGDYCVTGDTLTITYDEMQLTATRLTPATGTVEVSTVSPTPVPSPTIVAEVPQPADKTCPAAELDGRWKTVKIAIDDRLQQQLIKRVRTLDPDGECASSIGIRDEGTLTFAPKTSLYDGPASVKEKLSIDVKYGAACLAAKGVSCEALGVDYQKWLSVLDPLVTTACTVGSDGDCLCSRFQGGEEFSCTYTNITGNQYFLIPTRYVGSVFDIEFAHTELNAYCRSGDQLLIYADAMIIGGLRGDAVVTMQKQN